MSHFKISSVLGLIVSEVGERYVGEISKSYAWSFSLMKLDTKECFGDMYSRDPAPLEKGSERVSSEHVSVSACWMDSL